MTLSDISNGRSAQKHHQNLIYTGLNVGEGSTIEQGSLNQKILIGLKAPLSQLKNVYSRIIQYNNLDRITCMFINHSRT